MSANTMAAEIQELEDANDYLTAKLAHYETLNEESVPADLVWRMMDGANPIRVWREHRALTADQLAQAAGIPVHEVMRAEGDGPELSLRQMASIAKVLNTDVDMLIPWNQD